MIVRTTDRSYVPQLSLGAGPCQLGPRILRPRGRRHSRPPAARCPPPSPLTNSWPLQQVLTLPAHGRAARYVFLSHTLQASAHHGHGRMGRSHRRRCCRSFRRPSGLRGRGPVCLKMRASLSGACSKAARSRLLRRAASTRTLRARRGPRRANASETPLSCGGSAACRATFAPQQLPLSTGPRRSAARRWGGRRGGGRRKASLPAASTGESSARRGRRPASARETRPTWRASADALAAAGPPSAPALVSRARSPRILARRAAWTRLRIALGGQTAIRPRAARRWRRSCVPEAAACAQTQRRRRVWRHRHGSRGPKRRPILHLLVNVRIKCRPALPSSGARRAHVLLRR